MGIPVLSNPRNLCPSQLAHAGPGLCGRGGAGAANLAEAGLKFGYSWPHECLSIGTWFLCEWDGRHHWNGPYKLFRLHGIRFLGFEIEWTYLED